jgi:hypothetical protein
MSTHPKASHHTHLARGPVADNLARIEFTPDDLERLELFWTSRWRRRGRCSTTWGAGRHAFLVRFRPAMHATVLPTRASHSLGMG